MNGDTSGAERTGREYRVRASRGVRVLLLAVCALFLAFSHSHAREMRPLCVQLKWFHQSQFAGFYVALEDGYFREEGLDVTFVEGGPRVNWQERMRDDTCPVGITNAYEVAIAGANGVPIRAVAAINQVSPIVWFSLKESGIRSPRQFRDRNVVLVPTGKIHLSGMLKRVGLTDADVNIRPFSLDMSRMYEGKIDVWSGYHANLVTKAEQEGHEVNIIHPVDYGVQIYDDVVYVRRELILDSPGTVRSFLRASLKGWLKAIREPGHAVAQTMKYSKAPREHEETFFLRTIPYVHTGEVPIGWMEGRIWEDICLLTKEVGLIDECPSPQDVFTDEFLKDIYDEDFRF